MRKVTDLFVITAHRVPFAQSCMPFYIRLSRTDESSLLGKTK